MPACRFVQSQGARNRFMQIRVQLLDVLDFQGRRGRRIAVLRNGQEVFGIRLNCKTRIYIV